MMKRILFVALAAFSASSFGQALTLHGASQFTDEHAFTKDRCGIVDQIHSGFHVWEEGTSLGGERGGGKYQGGWLSDEG